MAALAAIFLLNGNNQYPGQPQQTSYPWYDWAAVGVFIAFWFFWYFVRPRLRR